MTNRIHQILVLGAGYAGLVAAQRLARRLDPDDVAVTVVTREPEFVERPRLHQVATGQPIRRLPLVDYLQPYGVQLRLGTVTGIDLANNAIHLDEEVSLDFDTLVLALGSEIDPSPVTGVAEHTVLLNDRSVAESASAQVHELTRSNGDVVVCGGGLTGLEIAAETAEQWPGVTVTLVSANETGGWFATRGQRYVESALDQLGVNRVVGRVSNVLPGRVELDTGEVLRADLCHWAGGFRPSPLVAASGLAVDDNGRAVVDEYLRAVSHPRVWVIGDAAAVPGRWGTALAMGCRTGGFTAPAAADTIAAELTGRNARPFRFRYLHECLSLGRKYGLVQFLDARGMPKRAVLTGRAAIAYKNMTLNSARFLFRHPGPYLRRRRKVAAALRQPTGRDGGRP